MSARPNAPRFTLEQVIARARVDHELADNMPEMTPATGERYFGEHEALCSRLSVTSDDITWKTKIGEMSIGDSLAYLALRTGDLHVMRAVAAYVMRDEAQSELRRAADERPAVVVSKAGAPS